jgi:pyruvate formate lyase activating enzyme
LFYHEIKDGRVQCDVCPHRCRLKEGQLGICRARACQHHKIVSLVYGHPYGLAVDPIEKKPLFHFLPDSKLLSFGTIGCSFRCAFCQNSVMSQSEPNAFYHDEDAVTAEMMIKKAQGNHCDGIAFTYNEPSIFIEYAMDIAQLARKTGIHNCLRDKWFH